jgi:hypothetical protein
MSDSLEAFNSYPEDTEPGVWLRECPFFFLSAEASLDTALYQAPASLPCLFLAILPYSTTTLHPSNDGSCAVHAACCGRSRSEVVVVAVHSGQHRLPSVDSPLLPAPPLSPSLVSTPGDGSESGAGGGGALSVAVTLKRLDWEAMSDDDLEGLMHRCK